MGIGSRCLQKKPIGVNGMLFGQTIKTSVDTELAAKMLTDFDDNSVHTLFSKYENQTLNTKLLTEISLNYSVDVATLYFLQRNYQDDKNRLYQDQYIQSYRQQLNGESIDMTTIEDCYVVFIPGLAYNEDTTTGADFAQQRQLLSAYGISNELVKTGEWDLSEENAKKIADKLKELSKTQDKIVVVSASKGGLEAAIALGEILVPAETKNIHSWVSVGGILRGSPIADNYLIAPESWFAKIMLWTKGKNMDLVRDLSYNKRLKDFERLSFPDHIKIIHFVGTPLSTKISVKIKGRYCSMKNKYGPNDGLTPIADEITKNGIIISELGLDHYYRHENIDKKTLSLALLAAK